MKNASRDVQTYAMGDQYRALLAVSEAILSHRELPALFHDMAARLHDVARYEYLALVLHEAATNTMRLNVLGTADPTFLQPVIDFPIEEDPAGHVWQSQQTLVIPRVSDVTRWPRWRERMQTYGVESLCFLPLTTARRRLRTLIFSCKQPSAYDDADVEFLQLVANQVAIAVENALSFQQIQALQNQLAKDRRGIHPGIPFERGPRMRDRYRSAHRPAAPRVLRMPLRHRGLPRSEVGAGSSKADPADFISLPPEEWKTPK